MKNLKKLMSILLTLCLTAALICMPALAATDGDAPAAPKLEGAKTATPVTGEPGKYTVEVFVPGADPDNRHDEVIIMVDGSTSVDTEWPAMSSAVKQIGADFLNGTGNTQLTLMAFGISPTVVKSHITSYAELEALLNQYQGNLLYGRSGTNCAAAFDGIREYITNHDATLADAVVIYISDGRVNLNNKTYVWKNCVNYVLSANNAADAFLEEVLGVYGGAAPSAAYLTVFGDKREALDEQAKAFFNDPTNKSVVNGVISAVRAIANEAAEGGITKGQRWASLVLEEVFAYVNLDIMAEYPVHVVEKAFVDHRKACGTNCQEVFYGILGSIPDNFKHVENGKACAISAAQAAAAVSKELFLVRYAPDYRSVWMDDVDSSNVTLVDAGAIGNVTEAIKNSVTEYVTTPFNDVVVTDYMSKWVNIDLDSLRIVDRSTDTVIWNAKEGWKIDEGRPTAQEVPVTAEKVDPADYEAGGADVIGNKIGDIYKLTWRVKDGALLRSDGYVLQYEVAVDDAEPGFRYDTDYPANGNTFADYIDQNQQPANAGIDVPEVIYNDPNPQPDPEPIYYHNITINYFDKNTGAAVAPSYVTAFEEGTVYDVSAQNGIAVSGYTWDSTDRADLLTGTLTGDVVINVFYVAGETVIIPEEPTPLPSAPSQDDFFIDEEDVPLADVPATGDPLTVMAAMSALSAAGVYFTRKKRDEE